jgi:hypothetical protein
MNVDEFKKNEEETAILKENLNQAQYSLDEYYNSIQAVLTFIKANGNDEELIEWLQDYSHLKPQELNTDQLFGIINCLNSI